MSKIAFIFPGQGSQYVGMGKDLAQSNHTAASVFAEADKQLGFSLSRLCFEGPEEVLRRTSITQPAILTTSMACYHTLDSEGIKPDYVAGHSLGEYSALVVSGAISFADAVSVVHQRGKLMEEAYPENRGGMAAILGLAAAEVQDVCQKALVYGHLQIANLNCPGQIVIAGERAALQQAVGIAKDAGAKRVVELAVSGPFHSKLMENAGRKFAQTLEKVEIKDPVIPIVANINAELLTSGTEVRTALVKQLSHAVRWEETIKKLYSYGVRVFVELGPEKVLCGLVKKTVQDVMVTNIQDQDSLQKSLTMLKGA